MGQKALTTASRRPSCRPRVTAKSQPIAGFRPW
jgi:hypothetical protein